MLIVKILSGACIIRALQGAVLAPSKYKNLMLLSALRQFNWVDIFFVILLIRIGYIALKNGLPVELFKFLGVLFASFIGCHYYPGLSASIGSGFGLNKLLPGTSDFLAFFILVCLTYLAFSLLRAVFYRFIKLEATPRLSKWGGFFLGFGRSFLSGGLIVYLLLIAPVPYLKHSVINAYSGKYLFEITANTYGFLHGGVVSKFVPGKPNEAVEGPREAFYKK